MGTAQVDLAGFSSSTELLGLVGSWLREWQPAAAVTEVANDGCRGYAKCLNGVRARASPRSDWTEFGVVSVSDLGAQRPQLGGPAAEATKPAADSGGRHAQRGGDATVTQAARLGQECGTDDLDHIEASEQRVRRKRRRRRPSGPRSSRSRANPQGPSTPSQQDGHRRRPMRSRASTQSGWLATASTLEFALPDPRPNPPQPVLPAGRGNSCCGWSSMPARLRKPPAYKAITVSGAPAPVRHQNERSSTGAMGRWP
jgi:hypothetical protein